LPVDSLPLQKQNDVSVYETSGGTMGSATPERIVFTGQRCRDAYRLNKFLMSMKDADVRASFERDSEKLMQDCGLNEQERDLVRRRDYQGMLDYGAVIYAVGKAATGFHTTLLAIGAQMRGEAPEAVAAWIAAGKNAER
jgi:protocatechuate 4,5-dioxygenase alpha subunit